MTAVTEPVGVPQVFSIQPMETLFKDRYFVASAVAFQNDLKIQLSSWLGLSSRNIYYIVASICRKIENFWTLQLLLYLGTCH